MRISKPIHLGLCVLTAAALAGCGHLHHKRVTAIEPPLISENEGVTTIVEAPVARPVTFADRHPLLNRPKQYYHNTNGGKFSKTVAATVIGVPCGIGAEVVQIVAGQAPAMR
ncbi:MAG: hypothetical protein JWN86_4675 [Planctomycetota bacterium]|nr:hypothetical protein [Planctomycetota bacterium]